MESARTPDIEIRPPTSKNPSPSKGLIKLMEDK
jgi:hypothetical protein